MRFVPFALFTLLFAAACRPTPPGFRPSPGGSTPGGHALQAPLSKDAAELKKEHEALQKTTAEQLLAKRALPFGKTLGYEPTKALGLEKIRKSSLAPTAAEEARLATDGFVISGTKEYPEFTYGYAQIYADHLPLYISADSILHAVHKSYDDALAMLEDGVLREEILGLLRSQRDQLRRRSTNASPEAQADVDLFLAVGLSLLTGKAEAPVAGASAPEIQRLVEQASGAQGTAKVQLFGEPREVDFSQFKPRGHYAGRPEREKYFRALIWFGRTEFRLVETLPNGEQALRRRQLEGALALAELTDGEARKRFDRVDQAIGFFVGENDAMTLGGLPALRTALGIADLPALARLDDRTVLARILESKQGAQRIASQLIVNDSSKPLPLHRSFQLFGQRYTLDSHVFSNVSFDRAKRRMMPSPLDAAYAALGNDQAALLLAPELKRDGYAGNLEPVRFLADQHGPDYWESSLYTLWLAALRELSPSREALDDPKKAGLPRVATTEAWGRRMLNTQLASWAELRHDTLLYAKQSYSASVSCEFPDAYVDPYPAFYARLVRYAQRGEELTGRLLDDSVNKGLIEHMQAHFSKLTSVGRKLQGMAERQRAGQPFTAEQMAFVNQTVKLESVGCGQPTADGWYPSLFLDPSKSLEFDPTIADVHTQPTDEAGNPVGKVLHVGTGRPRWMLVTADTCKGPRAYVGLVSSYKEKVTEQFQRLDDATWAGEFQEKSPPDAPWFAPLAVR